MPRKKPMILHLRGHVETRDFLAMGGLLATRQPSKLFLILFDWSEVTSWTFCPPAQLELQGWLDDAAFIDRLAIVHYRAWNRQAAWFAALLRARNCRVRSYHPHEHSRALTWLRESTAATNNEH